MSGTTQSEQTIAGCLSLWPGDAMPILDKSGVTESSFTNPVCLKVWRTVKHLTSTQRVVTADMVLCEMGDDLSTVAEYAGLCPSVQLVEYHVCKVREAEQRRTLALAVRDIGARLEAGGAVKVLAEQLKTAGEVVAAALEVEDSSPVENPLAGAKSLAELATQPIDLEASLLGERLLCRRGCLLYVGRSGLGKSSSSAQQDSLWALGRAAFGIVPSKPLNVLTVQAENDAGDLKEMALGVIRGLGLTDSDMEELHQRTTYVQWFENGEAFLAKLRAALEFARDAGKPFDLVRIDPLMAFAGGDLIKPDVIASFCRTGLNSIAFDFDCGIIAVHHTPKINLTARPRLDGPEWVYAATGCADLSNWSRAILVVTDCTSGSGVFRLIGAKRGKRVGWRDTNGEREFERHFAHAENDGGMYWREATPDEILSATSKHSTEKKPDALQGIAMKSPEEMAAHAERIFRRKPLNATDFNTAIMREFNINSRYAKEVSKMLSGEPGDTDKPVWVLKIGKQRYHGTPKQIDVLRNPPLVGIGTPESSTL